MVREFENASGQTIKYLACPRRPGDLAAVYADPTLAMKELGWVAERNLQDMCQFHFNHLCFLSVHRLLFVGKDVWRWQSNNPNGY